ncbi:unnamed protein product [Amoebophrya sp. A120]|nr:unnamed protein product [Amoebophrya sp. A120]|eukprot:GSA120T00024610001.1
MTRCTNKEDDKSAPVLATTSTEDAAPAAGVSSKQAEASKKDSSSNSKHWTPSHRPHSRGLRHSRRRRRDEGPGENVPDFREFLAQNFQHSAHNDKTSVASVQHPIFQSGSGSSGPSASASRGGSAGAGTRGLHEDDTNDLQQDEKKGPNTYGNYRDRGGGGGECERCKNYGAPPDGSAAPKKTTKAGRIDPRGANDLSLRVMSLTKKAATRTTATSSTSYITNCKATTSSTSGMTQLNQAQEFPPSCNAGAPVPPSSSCSAPRPSGSRAPSSVWTVTPPGSRGGSSRSARRPAPRAVDLKIAESCTAVLGAAGEDSGTTTNSSSSTGRAGAGGSASAKQVDRRNRAGGTSGVADGGASCALIESAVLRTGV